MSQWRPLAHQGRFEDGRPRRTTAYQLLCNQFDWARRLRRCLPRWAYLPQITGRHQNPANNLIAFMSDVPSSATFSLATLCRWSMLLFSSRVVRRINHEISYQVKTCPDTGVSDKKPGLQKKRETLTVKGNENLLIHRRRFPSCTYKYRSRWK